MENQVEKRALEMKKAIYKDIGGELKAPLAERDRVKQLIASRKLQLENYRHRAQEIEGTIEKQHKELESLLTTGENLEQISKGMNELRSELERINELIKIIEPHIVSLETKELPKTRMNTRSTLRTSVVHFHEQYTIALNENAKSLEAEMLAWHKTHQDMVLELKIEPLASHLQCLRIKNRTINNNTES